MTRYLLICTALLAGCAAPRPVVWQKYGEQPGEREKTIAECQYDSVKHAGGYDPSLGAIGSGIDMGLRRAEIFTTCMRSKGWIATRT